MNSVPLCQIKEGRFNKKKTSRGNYAEDISASQSIAALCWRFSIQAIKHYTASVANDCLLKAIINLCHVSPCFSTRADRKCYAGSWQVSITLSNKAQKETKVLEE